MKIVEIKKVGKKKVYDLSVKDVNHYALENGVISHNTGSVYNSDNIFIIGRQQEKDGTETTGYNFTLNVEKSRFVKEKSKFNITVSFENGVSRWSSLLDEAMDLGFVQKPSQGWYTKEIEGQKYREAETNTYEFWKEIIENVDFQQKIREKYQLASNDLLEV